MIDEHAKLNVDKQVRGTERAESNAGYFQLAWYSMGSQQSHWRLSTGLKGASDNTCKVL